MENAYMRRLTNKVLEIDKYGKGLNSWEINFIDSMLQKLPEIDGQQQPFAFLTAKQIKKIENIHDKCSIY